MSNKAVSVYAEAMKRQQDAEKVKPSTPASRKEKKVREVTPKSTREPTRVSEVSRDLSRDTLRDKPRDLPTREEIQGFSFSLRDELKVKVQAEVPHRWQDELEEIALKLKVKKLELYRFIIGEFLGKVQREDQT